ncbi:hypothetical protein PT974_10196 [Cladobotryum mycophilum]|uniref:Glycine zipper 2TM domain-containing protein n=1 Tax=Cladobotryum mycophilum TaxID=491253 RepID=A0ABR0S9B8_9HYPO
MSRYYETEQVAHHDHRDDDRNGPATWFQGHNPNVGEVAAPQGGRDADAYVRESMTLLPPPPNIALAPSLPTTRVPSSAASARGLVQAPAPAPPTATAPGAASPATLAIVEDNFTTSTTGIGAGIIGAVVGGFVANRASGALQDRHSKGGHKRHDSDDANVPRIASTILGAVAGGLGANALANHIEDTHDRTRDRHTWERRYSREEIDYRRSSRGRVYDRDEEEYDFVYDDDRKHRRRRSRDSGYRN